MKKLFAILVLLSATFNISIAENNIDTTEYLADSIEFFKNAPDADDLDKITDPTLRYCEETFLKAYMRREFTQEENNTCRELFTKRIEAELNYKNSALDLRWVN